MAVSVSGIFSTPVTGTYLFSYMVNTEVSSYQLMVKLVVDGVNESDAVSDPFHSFQVSINCLNIDVD